jgi:predicted Zn-dependent peptidase
MLMKEDIEETRFDNGLVVLTDRMAGVRSATLGFFYRTGARNESAELAGITHFIEHCVFKGTAKRSALEIAIEQDRLGGNLEAFTTHEETGFAIKVIDDQLDAAFDLLSDMLTAATFDENELASEQRVIIEEMKMTEDSPEEYLGELFSREFFPADPLGRPIVGTPETVKTFDSETTRKYHAANFHSANLVIVAAGNVEHETVLNLAQGLETTLVRGVADKSVRVPGTGAPVLVHQRGELEQAHLILGLPMVGAKSDKRYAAELLTNIIGGGMSSRLWQKIREERGLAYNVGASTAMYHDIGVFTIFAGTSPQQVEEVVDISVAELRDVAGDGVNEQELELAKHQARASVLMSLEDSAARAAALAQSEMVYGRQIQVEETLTRIEKVSVEEVVDLAREHFKLEKIGLAVIGDLKHLPADRRFLTEKKTD